jgi:uncharacterized membrane protein
MSAAALAAADLDERIRNFASLVGLVLVLVTLFTNQRQTALKDLEESVPDKRTPFTRELWIDVALTLVTLLLFLTGLPLVCDALDAFHPRAENGQLPVAFVIVWFLLLALLAWQVSLALGVRSARRSWMDDESWTSPNHWWQRRRPPSA